MKDTLVAKTRLYDAVKCILTLLVVFAHASRMHTSVGAVQIANKSAFLAGFTTYIYTFHMPLFIMISGSIFGYCIERQKYSDVKKFVLSKCRRLLLPYLFTGICCVAPVMCLLHITGRSFPGYIRHGILFSNDSRHLWFILALFWIYMIYILMRPLFLKGRKGLILVAAISLILFAFADAAPGIFQIRTALSYQLFFCLGMLFNAFYGEIAARCDGWRIAGYCLPLALLASLYFNPNPLTAYIYKLIGIAMGVFVCGRLIARFPNMLEGRMLGMIRKNSFGIYLFHPMIIYVLYFVMKESRINPVALWVMISLVSIALSVGITSVLRKLKMGFLIGE